MSAQPAGPVTYPEVMGIAARHLAAAVVAVDRLDARANWRRRGHAGARVEAGSAGRARPRWDRPPAVDPGEAEAVVAAWRAVLVSCGRQGLLVVGGPDRVAALVIAGGGVDPGDRAAIALTRAISDLPPAPARGPAPAPGRESVPALPVRGSGQRRGPGTAGIAGLAGVAGELRGAARSLGAATDLLATHRARGGMARGPGAPDFTDPAVRVSAYRDLAAVTLTAAGLAPALDRLTSRPHPDAQARSEPPVTPADRGVSGPGVTDAGEAVAGLPPVGAVLDAAIALQHAGPHGPVNSPALDVTVARPSIRTADPLLEITDRVARLQRMAWSLPDARHVGVATMVDLAAVAALLHQAAALTRDRAATARPGLAGDALHRDLAWIDPAGQAWNEAILALRGLRTAARHSGGVRGDAAALRQRIHDITDPAGGWDPEAVLPVLTQAARSQPVIATALVTVTERLADRGELYIPGQNLVPEQIGDDSTLIDAKLRHTLAVAPWATVLGEPATHWQPPVDRWDIELQSRNTQSRA